MADDGPYEEKVVPDEVYLSEPRRGQFDASRLNDSLQSLSLRPPVRVTLGSPLREAITRMREAKVGSCLIERADGVLAGIFTERDLLNRIPLKDLSDTAASVDGFMQPDPETLTPGHPIAYALNRMAGGGYRNIPLVDDDGRAVGLVTLRDIVDEICEHFSDDVLSLPPTRRAGIAKEREGA